MYKCKHLHKTEKKIKFRTKIALFGYFRAVTLKAIVVFEISSLGFVKIQSFVQKQKYLSFGQKFLSWVFLD